VEKLKAQGSKCKEKGPQHRDFDRWKGMVVIIETIGMFL
jgi:RNA polymerase subunit RPABC4/transcription elongation factor Spt4